MDRNGGFRCDKCRIRCNTIEDLAIHQAEHLFISIPFTEICPVCDIENDHLENLLHHFLEHLIDDQLQQAKLVRWMSLQNYESDNFISKRSGTPSSETYTEFKIVLPTIELHNKCLFCCKFFSPDSKVTKKVLEHIFGHILSSSQRIQRSALWAEKFFMLEESKSIVRTLNNFLSKTKTLDRSSHMLQELKQASNNSCRYCQTKVANASSLYSHYVEWHSEPPSKYFNCFLCNFKESDNIMFIDHFYKKHIGCACGEKFQCFEKCLKHVRGCQKHCPYCRNKFDFKGLVKHLTRNEVVDACPFCQEGMKSDQLRLHMSNCSSKPAIGVQCPTCRRSTFVEKENLENHLLFECKPWITNPNEELPCLNGSREKSPIPEKNNLVKFDDIQIHLSDETIGDHFS